MSRIDSNGASVAAATTSSLAGFVPPLLPAAQVASTGEPSRLQPIVVSAPSGVSSVVLTDPNASAPLFLRLLHNQNVIDGAGGWLCGVAQVATGHPLDTIKVRMQLQSAQSPLYSSMRDCAWKVWRNEGMRGLFKGAPAPMLGATTLNAVLFGTYGWAQRLFVQPTASKPTVRPGDLSLWQIWCCGFLAGSCVSLVESPDDLLKVKVQSQVGRGGGSVRAPVSYSGVFDALRKIVTGYGLRGMYQGWPATLLRNAPGCANSLMVYELCMRSWGGAPSPESQAAAAAAGLSEAPEEAPLVVSAAAGAAAGVGFWSLTYPLEMIKTRLQADHSDPLQRQYRSWLACARATYGELGLRGMYRGFVACQLRGVVVNASVFVTVEMWQRGMRAQQIKHPLNAGF